MDEEKKSSVKFVKSPAFRGLVICIAVLLILMYFTYNFLLASRNKNDIRTQTAVLQTIYKNVSTDIYFIRDEKLLSSSSANIIPAVENGVKVAGEDTVAYVLSNNEDAKLITRRAILEKEIKYYQSISSASSSSLIADINQDEKKISDSLDSLVENISSGNINALYDNSKELRECITKKQIDTGTVIDVSSKLEALVAEFNAIDSSEFGRSAVTADISGSFFSFTDGYEGQADYNNVLEATPETVEKYLASQPDAVAPSVFGKLVTQFAWYAVCCVKQSDIPTLGIGSSVTVCFPYSAADNIEMKVVSINKGDDGKTALVLRCTQMSVDIASLRIEKATLRVESFSGYRVENSAIRFVDGQQGVYVLYGNIINFRRINAVYQDENIALAYNTDNVTNHLKLYDEIITEGTDLYDGKIID